MNIQEFYDQLATLSVHAPTIEVAELALSLQVAIDKLDHDQYDDLHELFSK